MSTPEFTAPAPPGAETVEYASFARRVGAALLDSLVWIVGLSFFNPFVVTGDSEAASAVVALLIASAWFNYFAFCEWRWGQTIGKNATGIRVLPLEGGKLGWQTAAVRNLMRLVDLPLFLLGVAYVQVMTSPRRQRLGDRAAETIVVRERDEEARPAEPAAPAESPVTAAPAVPAPAAAELHTAGPAAGWSAPGFPYATWDARRSIAGLVAGVVLALLLPTLVLPFDTDLESPGALLAVQALFEAALIAAALWVAGGGASAVAGRARAALLGLRRFQRSDMGVAAQAVLAYYSMVALYAVFVTPDQEDVARQLGLDESVAAAIGAVVLIALAAPVVEEVFFRGMLFGGLRKRMGMYSSAAISAAVFGGLHATTGVSAVPPLFAFGFVLALLYERTGTIVPGIIVHVLNNSLALIASS